MGPFKRKAKYMDILNKLLYIVDDARVKIITSNSIDDEELTKFTMETLLNLEKEIAEGKEILMNKESDSDE